MSRIRSRLLSALLPCLAAGLLALVGTTPGQAEPLVKGDDPPPPQEITNSIGMKLRLIPAGKFLMGSPDSDKDAWESEKPQHEVAITRPFYLGVYTVTQEEYQGLMDKNPSYFSAKGSGQHAVEGMDTRRFPVEQVSWENAVAFCDKLSSVPEEKKADRVYRLPSEAEWEYACRACTNTAFWWGDKASSFQANFDGNHPYGGAEKGPYLKRPCPVGSYKANPWGLYDMHGNVWQWCADWYNDKYYGQGDNSDPKGPKNGRTRVCRGGCWKSPGITCRAAFRGDDTPRAYFHCIGFRVACDLAPRKP
jgi:formylglycine-generating enzyme required for sulfatase activity